MSGKVHKNTDSREVYKDTDVKRVLFYKPPPFLKQR